MAKVSGTTAQIIVGILALIGVLIVGWWQFVRKPEPHIHYYAVNVKDVASMAPIEHANVTLAWQSVNDLLPTGTDGAATFTVPTSTTSLRARVYVQATGFVAQDRDVAIPADDANVLFTLAHAEPPRPTSQPYSRVFTSGTVLSGVMKEWSPWYLVQADPPLPGYEIDLASTRYEVSGDRNCASYGQCAWAEHTAQAVSFKFTLQGHDERPYPGQVPGIGYLYVSYKPITH